MATITLVKEDIERGREALRALDEAGIRPRAAFWRYWPESSDWRFVVALPTFDREGPKRAYEQVQRVLQKGRVDLPLWRISVLSTDDPLAIWATHQAHRAGEDVRSSSSVADNDFIEDAYIYRSL